MFDDEAREDSRDQSTDNTVLKLLREGASPEAVVMYFAMQGVVVQIVTDGIYPLGFNFCAERRTVYPAI